MNKTNNPQDIILKRSETIKKFIETNQRGRKIIGWQLIARTSAGGSIISSNSDDNCPVDYLAIAMKSYAQQNRFENLNKKVKFECGIAECSPDSKSVIQRPLAEALQKFNISASEITAVTKTLKDRANIATIGDLLCFSDVEIKSLKGIGEKRFALIRNTLIVLGANFGILKRPRSVSPRIAVIELQIMVAEKSL